MAKPLKLPSRPFRRKDGKVRSRVLAIRDDGTALIEARWGPQGKFSNRTVVGLTYFADRYGVDLRAA